MLFYSLNRIAILQIHYRFLVLTRVTPRNLWHSALLLNGRYISMSVKSRLMKRVHRRD